MNANARQVLPLAATTSNIATASFTFGIKTLKFSDYE